MIIYRSTRAGGEMLRAGEDVGGRVERRVGERHPKGEGTEELEVIVLLFVIVLY